MMINRTVSYYNNADDSKVKSVITLIMSWV